MYPLTPSSDRQSHRPTRPPQPDAGPSQPKQSTDQIVSVPTPESATPAGVTTPCRALLAYNPMCDPLGGLSPASQGGDSRIREVPRRTTNGVPLREFFVCGRCFHVFGQKGGRHQLCGCATQEEHDTLGDAVFHESGTYWTKLRELCRCCGAETVAASHKFARWFCDECLGRVTDLNRSFGSCVVPIGWHSTVNGVVARSRHTGQLPQLGAFTDQLNAFFRESGGTWGWGLGVIERHWKAAGLRAGDSVPLPKYLAAVGSLRIDKAARFDELRAARGLPDLASPPDRPVAIIDQELP